MLLPERGNQMEERRTTVTRTEPTVVRDEVSTTNVTTASDDSGFSWGVLGGIIAVVAILVIAALVWQPWNTTSTVTSSSNTTINSTSTDTGTNGTSNGGTQSTTTTNTNSSTNP